MINNWLRDQTRKWGRDPEQRNLCDPGAKRLENLTDIGILQGTPELIAQTSETQVSDLPEAQPWFGSHRMLRRQVGTRAQFKREIPPWRGSIHGNSSCELRTRLHAYSIQRTVLCAQKRNGTRLLTSDSAVHLRTARHGQTSG